MERPSQLTASSTEFFPESLFVREASREILVQEAVHARPVPLFLGGVLGLWQRRRESAGLVFGELGDVVRGCAPRVFDGYQHKGLEANAGRGSEEDLDVLHAGDEERGV